MSRHLPVALLAAVLLGTALSAASASQEQAPDEPVGWPRRLPSDNPRSEDTSPVTRAPAVSPQPDSSPPMPVAPSAKLPSSSTEAGSAPSAMAHPALVKSRNAALSSPRVVPPGADIGAIDRFTLPIAPARLTFAGIRTALTREETRSLDRLALRLRLHPESILVTGHAAPDGRGRDEARRLALTRALAVRHYLIEDGVDPVLIEVMALPQAAPETGGDAVSITSADGKAQKAIR